MKKDVFIAVKPSSYRLSAQLAALLFLSSGLAAETVPPASVLMEAEQGTFLGSRSYDDPGASGGKAVGWMGAVRFDQVPAANCIRLRYAWNVPTGAQLMDKGLEVPMGPNASEIVWLDLSK